ncbi:MAG: sulfotransferase [Deltaproteobacteria bacterium]|nr:sulfotransferase [Deltaproteobacteria bacterium]
MHPIIIIGAGRSGTNMLRDILVQPPDFGTWPCDEINYIWRHGNMRHPTDEFAPELATEQVRLFIRRAFAKIAKKQMISYVVEKTCANSLRVSFVKRIFPEARFIHIIRDGRDVVASAQKRWVAPLDLPYIMRKARFVPFSDLPYYASRYLWNRVYRLVSGGQRLAFWGPRFAGMEQALQKYSLAEVCAIQWQRSVEKAELDFEKIAPTRVYRLRYEDFVTCPDVELQRLGAFLKKNISLQQAKELVREVSTSSVARWKSELDQQILASVESLIGKTLKRHGYQTTFPIVIDTSGTETNEITSLI